VLNLLAAIDVSKRAGFSLAEIATLFAFAPSVSPSERWHRLAQSKLLEIEALIARAEAMREVLRLDGLRMLPRHQDGDPKLASGSSRRGP
jgi:DNA-binding transcriptional MerR regulator